MVRPCTRSLSLYAKPALIALPMDQDEANCKLILPADNPAEVTPPKQKQPARSKDKIYFRVTLKDHPSQFIVGKTALDRFKADYGPLVVKVYGYSSKKNFDEMKKKHAIEPLKPKANCEVTKLDDSELARSIIKEMAEQSDRDAFRGHYLIKSDSPLCIVVIHLTGQKGDDHWCWKPDLMTGIISKIFRNTICDDAVIKSAFENLTYGPAPDPNDITGETQKVISYTPRNTDRTVQVYLNTAYTFFTIPVTKIYSKDNEKDYILSKLTTFFNEMKSVMLSKTFKQVMDTMRGEYSGKIYDPARAGNNLHSFLSKAGIRLSETPDFEGHFTHSTIQYLMSKLFATRLPNAKYHNVPPNGVASKPQDGDAVGEEDTDDGSTVC